LEGPDPTPIAVEPRARAVSWYDLSQGNKVPSDDLQYPGVGGMSDGLVSRPWRRFLRYSVRGLILLVLVVGVWLGWIVRSARLQHAAVAAIEKDGGFVIYDGWNSDNGRWTNSKPWRTNWLTNTIGVDYFADVKDVINVDLFDDTLRHVGQLRQIQTLEMSDIGQRKVTDAGLAHLKGLTKLLELHLSGSEVTDAGMVYLKDLTALKILELSGSEVTDAGMVYLKDLTALKILDLNYTHVTDAGLVHLKGLTNLAELSVVPCVMTRAELAQLPDNALEEFNGYHVQVTDAGLIHLSNLSNISKLNLMGIRVTDAGLAHLKGLKKLSYLNLKSTQVTDAGVKELQQALPSLKIVR
jgi:Leucine Rich Repeat (LRR) protein